MKNTMEDRSIEADLGNGHGLAIFKKHAEAATDLPVPEKL